jgi:hypothetical protein
VTEGKFCGCVGASVSTAQQVVLQSGVWLVSESNMKIAFLGRTLISYQCFLQFR